MSTRIVIEAGGVRAQAELNGSPAAAAILAALPIDAVANTWGEEVYFDIGLDLPLADDARADVAAGELGYWPAGAAFCIFFGRTPASRADGAPRAASPVNPLGRLLAEPKAFAAVRDGDPIRLRLAD